MFDKFDDWDANILKSLWLFGLAIVAPIFAVLFILGVLTVISISWCLLPVAWLVFFFWLTYALIWAATKFDGEER